MQMSKLFVRAFATTLIATFVSGCAGTTGTRIALAKTKASPIRNLGIQVILNTPFTVHMSQERGTDTGAALGSFLGAGMESGLNTAADKRIQKVLAPQLAHFDLGRELAANLQ